MRYLRDSTFVMWACIVLAMSAVLVFAYTAGSAPEPSTNGSQVGVSVRTAPDSEAGVFVEQLRGLAAYGVAAGVDEAALTAWAAQVQDVAGQGAAVRATEGAGGDDPLLMTLNALAATAGRLGENAGDRVEAVSLRTSILLGVDRATALINGLPVPAAVEGVGGGLGSTSLPQVPQVPGGLGVPEAPAEVPGQDHDHPVPTLPAAPVVASPSSLR